uniref:Uncharacterized protein n=1 Tax=Rhizophora mucronata TaxID=61149 RepID=A0A2P2N2Q7_RHIMU
MHQCYLRMKISFAGRSVQLQKIQYVFWMR